MAKTHRELIEEIDYLGKTGESTLLGDALERIVRLAVDLGGEAKAEILAAIEDELSD